MDVRVQGATDISMLIALVISANELVEHHVPPVRPFRGILCGIRVCCLCVGVFGAVIGWHLGKSYDEKALRKSKAEWDVYDMLRRHFFVP